MSKYVLSGAIILTGLGIYCAKTLFEPRTTVAPATITQKPDYSALTRHIDKAITELTPQPSDETVPFFGFESFEISAGRNARPAAARLELEQVIGELPEPQKKDAQDIYDRLRDATVSNYGYEKERAALKAIKDSFRP